MDEHASLRHDNLTGLPQNLRSDHSRFLITYVYRVGGKHFINIYNGTYIPILGNRHPKDLGESAREILADIWDVIEAKQAKLAAGAAGYLTKESAGQELNQLLPRLLHKSTPYDI